MHRLLLSLRASRRPLSFCSTSQPFRPAVNSSARWRHDPPVPRLCTCRPTSFHSPLIPHAASLPCAPAIACVTFSTGVDGERREPASPPKQWKRYNNHSSSSNNSSSSSSSSNTKHTGGNNHAPSARRGQQRSGRGGAQVRHGRRRVGQVVSEEDERRAGELGKARAERAGRDLPLSGAERVIELINAKEAEEALSDMLMLPLEEVDAGLIVKLSVLFLQQGNLDRTLQLVDLLWREKGRNLRLVHYNNIVLALITSNRVVDAVDFVNLMEERKAPHSLFAIQAVASACLKLVSDGEVDPPLALKLLDQTLSLINRIAVAGVHPPSGLLSVVLLGFCRMGRGDDALALMRDMQLIGREPGKALLADMVRMMGERGDYPHMIDLLHGLKRMQLRVDWSLYRKVVGMFTCAEHLIHLRQLAYVASTKVEAFPPVRSLPRLGQSLADKGDLSFAGGRPRTDPLGLSTMPVKTVSEREVREREAEEKAKRSEKVSQREQHLLRFKQEEEKREQLFWDELVEKMVRWASFDDALPFFSRCSRMSEVAMRRMVRACGERGAVDDAVQLVERYEREAGHPASSAMYAAAVEVCRQPLNPAAAQDICRRMRQVSGSVGGKALRALMDVLCAAEDLEAAVHTLEEYREYAMAHMHGYLQQVLLHTLRMDAPSAKAIRHQVWLLTRRRLGEAQETELRDWFRAEAAEMLQKSEVM